MKKFLILVILLVGAALMVFWVGKPVWSGPEMILEVYSRENSVCYPPDTEVLLLRVYDNGEVEFDDYPADRTAKPWALERKRSVLARATFDELKPIVESVRHGGGAARQKPRIMALDANVVVTFRIPENGKIREIVVEENECRVYPVPKSLRTVSDFVYRQNDELRGIPPLEK